MSGLGAYRTGFSTTNTFSRATSDLSFCLQYMLSHFLFYCNLFSKTVLFSPPISKIKHCSLWQRISTSAPLEQTMNNGIFLIVRQRQNQKLNMIELMGVVQDLTFPPPNQKKKRYFPTPCSAPIFRPEIPCISLLKSYNAFDAEKSAYRILSVYFSLCKFDRLRLLFRSIHDATGSIPLLLVWVNRFLGN